jgi:4-hydroxy 2-oxovalerate aldolase
MTKNSICILDCTLRDSGGINGCCFGKRSIRSIISRLDSAGVDIIEVGYLDSRVEYDPDKSIYPDIQSLERTLARCVPKQAKLVAMVDVGRFPKELLIDRERSSLEGIRLAFYKPQLDEAIEFGHELRRRCYKIFLNPMSLTSYHDHEIDELIQKVNILQPTAVSIVDSYGLMLKNDLLHYANLMDSQLNESISLGFHAHNNLQMANANCFEFIAHETARTKIIDSSILGIAKDAGNACTELILSYIEKNDIKQVDLNQILECAYTDIYRFHGTQAWGYNLKYLISAIHDCPPKWTNYLMDKYTLSIKDIRAILALLPFERRQGSYFTKELAEQKYFEYMDHFINDEQARLSLKKALSGRKVLLLCPGKSIETQRGLINAYIEKNNPIIVTINFVSDAYPAAYAFISNSLRYSNMLGDWHDMHHKPIVALTSNITPIDGMQPEYLFNYKTLYESIGGDSSAVMFLSLLQDIGIKAVSLAGFDGFDDLHPENNYYSDEMSFPQPEGANARLAGQLGRLRSKGNIIIDWITISSIEHMLTSTKQSGSG